MKVLVVCHRLPYPPKRGGKIRPFNIIRHLHEKGHQVTVASLARSPAEEIEGGGLNEFCNETLIENVSSVMANLRMVARLALREPSSMGYFYSSKLKLRIDELARTKGFDLVFVHCSSVAHYVADLQGPLKIFDLGDIDSQKWLLYAKNRSFPLSAGYWLEGVKLEREEKRLATKFDFCTCTTKAELETFESFSTGVPCGWFPNGVDAEYFSPSEDEYDSNKICFVGRMDYFPNQQGAEWFCDKVFPLLRRAKPSLKFEIVGASPSRRVRSLGSLAGVTVTGSVPDVRPHVTGAALTVAPLRIARGTQNKILESMAMGVPVVASAQAAPGVDAVPGKHLIVARTPEEYVAAIMRITSDAAYRSELSRRGRERVISNHGWDSSMRKLDAILENCFAGKVDNVSTKCRSESIHD